MPNGRGARHAIVSYANIYCANFIDERMLVVEANNVWWSLNINFQETSIVYYRDRNEWNLYTTMLQSWTTRGIRCGWYVYCQQTRVSNTFMFRLMNKSFTNISMKKIAAMSLLHIPSTLNFKNNDTNTTFLIGVFPSFGPFSLKVITKCWKADLSTSTTSTIIFQRCIAIFSTLDDAMMRGQ